MDVPNRVDICPNGHNIGCFVMKEGKDLQAELEGSLLSGYQEAEITEVYFDRKLVLILGHDGQQLMSGLGEFTKHYPRFFRELERELPFLPDCYDLVVMWEINRQIKQNVDALFNYDEVPF
ncbi:MAG: hypothetical protein VKK42_20220 [Lyngbya sp.]|nr:hypothetical protein [Lyngbya sp.]